jgi:hypothetical protein
MKSINIQEFMRLPDEEKAKYTHRYFTNDAKTEFHDLDVRVFTAQELQFVPGARVPMCEMCDVMHDKYIGTSDPREPKFCFKHFIEINKESIFFIAEGA